MFRERRFEVEGKHIHPPCPCPIERQDHGIALEIEQLVLCLAKGLNCKKAWNRSCWRIVGRARGRADTCRQV